MVSSLLKAGFKSSAKGSKRKLLKILPMKQGNRLYLGDSPRVKTIRKFDADERARALRILNNPEVQAQFKARNKKILLPFELEDKAIVTENPMDAWAEGSRTWVEEKRGDSHFRNMGSQTLGLKGKNNITGEKLPLQTAGAAERKRNRGANPDQAREQNLIATTPEGVERDFGKYRGDQDFPGSKREVAKILNIPIEQVRQHHYSGAAHWGWLFRNATAAQAAEMHQILAEAGIRLGDTRYNRTDLPKAIHDILHRTLESKGLLGKKGDFSKIPFDQRKVYLQEMITDQRFVNEITYDIMSQYQRGVALSDIEYGKNPYKPKKAEPNWTGIAKKAIDGQIGKSGWDEARWRSANTQFTWSKADNRGYIDIIKDTAGDDAVSTLKAQFFKEIDKLPSGTTWTLEADTAQKYRIYKRMFRDDPRIKPGGDKKLLEARGIDHFVLTIP